MTETAHDEHLVWFRGDKEPGKTRDRVPITVPELPPVDTRDPRYLTCTDHHLACDCREAELNEEANEHRACWQAARDAAREICDGHPTWPDYFVEERAGVYEVTYAPSADCCQCTGCQIIRKAHL